MQYFLLLRIQRMPYGIITVGGRQATIEEVGAQMADHVETTQVKLKSALQHLVSFFWLRLLSMCYNAFFLAVHIVVC